MPVPVTFRLLSLEDEVSREKPKDPLNVALAEVKLEEALADPLPEIPAEASVRVLLRFEMANTPPPRLMLAPLTPTLTFEPLCSKVNEPLASDCPEPTVSKPLTPTLMLLSPLPVFHASVALVAEIE